ncbi:hypothetical protein [Colwellia sp. RSH04]|uniref:hypothetical protein n=1 Tax=Colwellia sp. RSH04 TaxID=2305464 RepID=UPI000E597A65|nr:hypothetical protein [Colwellia sp. RSH04]RHW75392.1 hypothetical protein D1094_13405 [Colwellia sp. RSH04]
MEADINVYLPLKELWPLIVIVLILMTLMLVKKVRDKPFALASLLGAIFIVCFIVYGSYKNSITLKNNELTVYAGGFSKSFNTEHACLRVASYTSTSGYPLSLRTAGTSMAGYRAGYFKNKYNTEVFVLITGQMTSASQYQFEQGLLLIEDSPAVLRLMKKVCE